MDKNYKLIMSPEDFKRQASTWRFESGTFGQAKFEQVAAPGPFKLSEGHFWNDAALKQLQAYVNGVQGAVPLGLNTNVTAVTATNPNPGPTALMTFDPKSAGYQNILNRTIYFWGAGTYTTAAAQTPTIKIDVLVGSQIVLTWTSSATTASVTKGWNCEGYITTGVIGATGQTESHGIMDIELGAGAAGSVAVTAFNDANAALTTAQDLTIDNVIKFQVTMNSSNAGNSVQQRQLIVQVAS